MGPPGVMKKNGARNFLKIQFFKIGARIFSKLGRGVVLRIIDLISNLIIWGPQGFQCDPRLREDGWAPCWGVLRTPQTPLDYKFMKG